MGSLPTFNPNIFANPAGVPASTYKQLNNASSNFPLINRAIMSAYPTGSTFKPITATAALESGAWTVGDIYDDTGVYSNGPGDRRHNAGHASYGVLDLTEAIKVSSDDFFYNLGAAHERRPSPDGGALQHWAHLYGIGQKTGIDLGGENAGQPARRRNGARRVDRERAALRAQAPRAELRDRRRPPLVGRRQREPRRGPGRRRGHAAAARGRLLGDRQRRHGRAPAHRPGGRLARRDRAAEDPAAGGPPHQHRARSTSTRSATGLREAASQPGGTSADVMGDFPEAVYGKTGTAQRNGQADQSWYACFVPDTATSKPILVVVTVEQGGFGAAGRGARRRVRSCRSGSPARWARSRQERRRHCERRQPLSNARGGAGDPCAPDDPVRSAAAARGARPDRLLADHAEGRHAHHQPGPPPLLRRAPGRLRGDRPRGRAGPRQHRLLAAARVQVRPFYGHVDRAQHRRLRDAAGARRPPLDPAAVLPVPVVGVRQDPADRIARGVRRGSIPAPARAAHDRPDHAAGAGSRR